jgi:hypothetical protein
LRFAGRRIDEIDVAGLFVNDCVSAAGSSHDVEVIVMGKLFDLLGRGVVREKIGDEITIREEVDGIAKPHRRRVIAVVPGKFLDRVVTQIH